MSETHVMVVDDERIVCDRLKEHLEKAGATVDTFTESTKALESLETNRYHVVVTDLKMAGPSGLDVLHNVKDRGLPTQVIIITGYGSFEAAREAEAVGAFDFLCKPLSLKELTKKVKRAAKQAKHTTDLGGD
jgi:two-component system C4-dicarboxylate transport response regulator DctD